MSIHKNDCNRYDNEENKFNDNTHRSIDIYDISCDDNYIMVTLCSRMEVTICTICPTKLHRIVQ